MKKIIITESQSKKVMGKILSEQLAPEERYSQEVNCSFGYHKLTYKGHEIDWIPDTKFRVSFTIYVDAREYGIKDIGVMNVRGPEAIDVLVTYYPEGSDDHVEEDVVINLNWDDVKVDHDADIGWIGIDQDIEMDLDQTPDGGLICGGILVHAKEI